jgi:ParB family chromosome partitioning protein
MLRLESILMPAPTAGDGQPLAISLDLIDEDPNQPRSEFEPEALRELAETIARRGVHQPISVRHHPSAAGRWMLNFGARRVRASRLAGKLDIPAFIDDAADSYDQVIENEQRERLKPLDLAMFIKGRTALGETQSQIAGLLGKSQSYIATVSALIDAPGWLMNAYRSGQCRGIAELYQLRRLHEKWPGEVDRWLKERGAFSRAELTTLADALTSPRFKGIQSEGRHLSRVETSQRTAGVAEPQCAKVDSSRQRRRRGPRFALMATLDNEWVEIILKPVPGYPEALWICHRGQLLTASVGSLTLVGVRKAESDSVDHGDAS